MAVRFARIIGFLLIALGSSTPVQAGWWDGCTNAADRCFGSIARDIKRRQCWPEPFTEPDRTAVRAPMVIMVNNGWRRQNMLGEFHFEPATGQLTEAGRLKIRWIVTEAPEQHRIVYVHTADSNEETATRIAAVQQLVARYAPPGETLPVLPTSISDEGSPADQVDLIGRKFQTSTPEPRLPAKTDSSGSGSSSGSSGSGGGK
jgi:hypothetical protein